MRHCPECGKTEFFWHGYTTTRGLATCLNCKTMTQFEEEKMPQHDQITVNIPAHDADIELILPNGKKAVLQWRVEDVSLDICLPEDKMLVTCWEGNDMDPAKPYLPDTTPEEKQFFQDGHVRLCGQLVVDFGPEYLKETP